MTFQDPGARSPVNVEVRFRSGNTPFNIDALPDYAAPDSSPTYPALPPVPGNSPALDLSTLPDYTDQQQRAPPTEGEPSPLGMQIDFTNQMRAAAQHTSPNVQAHAKDLLGNVVQDEADNFFYTDAQGNLTPLNEQDHVILQDRDGQLKAYARTEKTEEGMLAGLGRFAIAGSGPGQIVPAATRIPAGVAAAQRLGVSVPGVISTGSPTKQFIGQALSKMPGGGGLHQNIEHSIEQLGETTQEAIARSGGTPDANVAGASFRQGIDTGFKPGMKKTLGALYDAVDAGVDQSMLHRLDATTQTAGDIAGTHASYGDQWTGEGAKLIANAIQRPEGLNYQSIKNLRTRVGEMLDTSTFPEGTSETEMRRLYGGLSDDLRAAVRNAGSPQALADFERANSAAKQAQVWKDNIEKVLGTTQRSNEGISATLHRMAGKGASADIKALTDARAAVPKGAWADVAANTVARLGRDKAGNFSPTRFVSDYADLSDAGKKILFGGSGDANLVPFLDDIADVSKTFKQASKFANFSGSAGHATFGIAMLEAAQELFHGDWKAPMAILGAAVGAAGAAKVLGRPASVASLARWSRAYRALATNPTPATMVTFNMTTRNLAKTISGLVGMTPNDIEQHMRQETTGPQDINQRLRQQAARQADVNISR